MLTLISQRAPAWLLGLVGGLLFFLVFVGAVSIIHIGTKAYPQADSHLTPQQQDNVLAQYHDDQCERPRSGAAIAEWQNTLSNFGYAVVGALICLYGTHWVAQLLGLNLIILSVTSGLYHATLDHGPQVADVGSVYAVLLALSAYVSLSHTRAPRPYAVPVWLPIVIGAVVVTAGVILSLTQRNPENRLPNLIGTAALPVIVVAINLALYACRYIDRRLVFVVAPVLFIGIPVLGLLMRSTFGWDSTAVFILLVMLLTGQLVYLIVTARSCAPRIGWEIGAIVAVLVPSFVLRLSDGYATSRVDDQLVATRHLLCAPDSFIQPHALWHVLSAAGLLLAYDLVAQFQRDDAADARVPTVLFAAKPAEGP